MTGNIKKPDISPDFTIEDIHKIREWHAELYKGMTRQEIKDFINKGSDEAIARMLEIREEKKQRARQNNA